MNYLVVLFKDKSKKKIINKFITLERAKDFFDKKITENNQIYFEKKIENAKPCDFELCILEKKNNKFDSLYVKDDLGRQVKVELEDDDFSITKISNYNIEELFVNYQTKEKIDIQNFIENYLSDTGVILISKLNNKIVVQNDDDYNLFTFKNVQESGRFVEVLTKYLIEKNKQNCIIVKDTSTSQRKYLYNILVEKGFSKNYLMRHSTTHPE